MQNKLNIKNELQDFWDKKEETQKEETQKEGEEMPIKNDWVNDKKDKKTKDNYSFNLNIKKESEYKSTIILTIISIVTIYLVYELYSYNEIKKQNDAILNQQIIEYNNQVIERQKALNAQSQQQNQTYNQNGNYKYFKIRHETIEDIYDRNFNYNIYAITNELSKAVSRKDDNNYDIEIVGSISKYGGFFYRIDKRKTSNEYDDQINNILAKLKKITFRLQDDTVNFKIYVNNNSMNLN